MRRQRKWNVGLLTRETAVLLFMSMCFLVGSVIGCLMSGIISMQSGAVLLDYVQEYIAVFARADVRPAFASVVLETIRFPFIALVLSFTALGVLGLPLLFAVRGFMLSFAISAFYRLFGAVGYAPALVLFGLSAVIWLPALFHLGVQGMLASYSLLRRAVGEWRHPLPYDYGYLVRIGACAAALAACIALEHLVVPVLLQAIAVSL